MNKVLELGESRFNIHVKLNSFGEKHLGGERFHVVTVSDMGMGSYSEKYEISSNENLEDELAKIENITRNWIDGSRKSRLSKEERLLTDLGFTK